MSKPFSAGAFIGAADLNDLVGVYDRSTSTVDVVSTLVETTIYSKVIGAGHLSTNRALKLALFGDYLNNSGGLQNTALGVYFGGTQKIFVSQGFPNDVDRSAMFLEVTLANLGATNSQAIYGHMLMNTAPQAHGVGTGYSGGAVHFFNTMAVDTTIAQTLLVTAVHDLSSANLSLRKKYAILELL